MTLDTGTRPTRTETPQERRSHGLDAVIGFTAALALACAATLIGWAMQGPDPELGAVMPPVVAFVVVTPLAAVVGRLARGGSIALWVAAAVAGSFVGVRLAEALAQ